MGDLSIRMAEPVFRLPYRVIYGDTDAGGVVYNANYLRYFEMARTEMMRAHALPYSKIEERGLILPVTEAYLRYKAPARYDVLIAIDTCLAEVKKVFARHSDHHYIAAKRYQVIEHLDAAPQLPAAYGTMLLVVLLPPLWRRIMDPRVEQWRLRHWSRPLAS